MHIVECGYTDEAQSRPRAFVPIDLTYVCATCPDYHRISTLACVDSGADRGMLPSRFLPPDAPWTSLTRLNIVNNVFPSRAAEYRVWRVRVSVFGVPIATEIYVADDNEFALYPIAGIGDLFMAFNVAFAFSSQPPIVTLQPHGQVEPMPTIRWTVDPIANTWEGTAVVADASLPAGTSSVEAMPWSGRMPRLAQSIALPQPPQIVAPPEPLLLNRRARREAARR